MSVRRGPGPQPLAEGLLGVGLDARQVDRDALQAPARLRGEGRGDQLVDAQGDDHGRLVLGALARSARTSSLSDTSPPSFVARAAASVACRGRRRAAPGRAGEGSGACSPQARPAKRAAARPATTSAPGSQFRAARGRLRRPALPHRLGLGLEVLQVVDEVHRGVAEGGAGRLVGQGGVVDAEPLGQGAAVLGHQGQQPVGGGVEGPAAVQGDEGLALLDDTVLLQGRDAGVAVDEQRRCRRTTSWSRANPLLFGPVLVGLAVGVGLRGERERGTAPPGSWRSSCRSPKATAGVGATCAPPGVSVVVMAVVVAEPGTQQEAGHRAGDASGKVAAGRGARRFRGVDAVGPEPLPQLHDRDEAEDDDDEQRAQVPAAVGQQHRGPEARA